MNKNTECLFEFDLKARKNILDCIYDYLIGVDEAGRGPGAGPVYTAAVCFRELPKDILKLLSKLNDSKQITEAVREELYPIIVENSLYSINSSDEKIVDEKNIYNATSLAMKASCENVITQLGHKNVLTLVDGKVGIRGYKFPQTAIIKGDTKSASIAAGSILAKVSRDRFMVKLHNEHPEYNWAQNKGYLTKDHIEAIKKHGVTPYHRLTFLKNIANAAELDIKEKISQQKITLNM